MGQQSVKNKPSKVGLATKKENTKNTLNDDYSRLETLIGPFYIKIDSVTELIKKKYDTLNHILESYKKDILQKDISDLNQALEQLKAYQIASEFNFIRNNSSSYASIDRLSFRLKRPEGIVFYDTIRLLFNNLNKTIQVSNAGRQFMALLTKMNKSGVGSIAPIFTIKDINNKQISLSSLRYKSYVLLDFWASWCAPCMDDMPFLKDIYRSYNKKGLEIIGISQDYNISKWKNAIAKDSIQIWKHVLVQNSYEKSNKLILDNYFIHGIPVKVLINKDGLIIGRWRGGGEENRIELKRLLNNVFIEN